MTVATREISKDQRDQMAKSGMAMPDGSFPIETVADLQAAISSYGRAKDKPAAQAHITKRARSLKRTDLLPADWAGSTKTAADPGPSDVHIDGPIGKKRPGVTFLAKLREILKGHVNATIFDEAVKSARGHAGGKARAAMRRAYDPWGISAIPSMDMMGQADDMEGDDDMELVLFEKADARVNYRMATAVGTTCQDCQNFCEHDASCRLVEGTINENAVCDLFQVETEDESNPIPMRELADVCSSGKPWRLFNEAAVFATPPDWMPVLPKPGVYKHPSYGDLAISQARNERFVQNFNAHVYQDKVPVDAEHETKLSGAFGWLTELRMNADGSADAKVDWTDRGTAAIEADSFKYVSPEWYDQWTDPATGATYQDVLIGAAITTRPFFKDSALRPLVASERGVFAHDVSTSRHGETVVFLPMPIIKQEVSMAGTPPTSSGASVALTEEQAKQFAEMRAELDTIKAERDAIKVASEAQAAQSKALAETISAMETKARRLRFTDEVLGKSDANGSRWFGEVEKSVGVLEHLATTAGEDSEIFKGFVSTQRALAEQLKDSALFKDLGSNADGSVGASAWQKIETQAKALSEKTAGLTYEQAVDKVIQADSKLAAEYVAERKAGR